jgi:hypothetical protein
VYQETVADKQFEEPSDNPFASLFVGGKQKFSNFSLSQQKKDDFQELDEAVGFGAP